jgi:Ca-activated chloride channel family protein
VSFDRPWWIAIALLITVAFAYAYDRLSKRASARDLAYSNVPFFMEAAKPRAWIPRAFQWAWIVALACATLAVAGPHLDLPVPARDGNVFICIDTSGSMASTDVTPTRSQAAKAAAAAFIEQSPPGTKVGIISFSGAAGVVQPLTADHQQAVASLDDVPLPNGATAIGDALQLAARSFPPNGHRVIVLVTDGVNNAGVDPSEVAQWLGAHHIPVYTVGIGTAAGGLIPGTNEEATIDEEALRGYAQLSGGAYARVENATELRDALSRLGRITSIERKTVDASLGFALAGAAGMILAFVGGFAIGRYP